MIYTLENSTIKITASTHGGELHSITGKNKETEYLWNGNPEYWKYHSPLLFPIIGKVTDSKYKVEKTIYELPQHGLARTSEFNLLSKTDDSITFQLKYSENSLKVYPFKFALKTTYTIHDNSVTVTYTVINLDSKEILFSIGAHPAFMCPIDKNETLEDYYLQFNEKETSSIMVPTKEVYLTHKRNDYLNNSDLIELSKDTFKNDVLIFSNLKSDKITIKSKNNNKSLSVEFGGFPYLGIWAPPTGAPFICIEPWFGHSDYEDFNGEFKYKEGVVKLETEKEFSCIYKISITEF